MFSWLAVWHLVLLAGTPWLLGLFAAEKLLVGYLVFLELPQMSRE